MNTTWKAFLQTQGLREGDPNDFGDAAAERSAALNESICAELGPYALIEAKGEDAATFLQGQFTNDVRAVDETHAQLSAWCTAKGRILANFRLLQRDGAYVILVSADLLETLLKRLRMYVLRSKVELHDLGAELSCCGLAGPHATAVLEAQGITPPQAERDSVTQAGITVMRVGNERFIALAEAKTLQKVWLAAQEQGCRAAGFHAWQLLEINAGVPWIGAATSETFTPQMVNYEVIGGVSFNKGCYTGQEVVARTHYLGKAKRRMHLLRWHGETLTVGGDLPGDESAGQVVDVQVHPDGGCVLLAVLKEGTPLPAAAESLPLPYALPA